MNTAFVLISADPGIEDQVLQQVLEIEHVKEAFIVYGVYDIVAKVEAESLEEIKQTVSWKIRGLENIQATMTLLAVEPTPTAVMAVPSIV